MNYKNLNWLWVSVPIIILDQITKRLATNHLIAFKQTAIFPWLNLHLIFNKGAAFGFLHHAGGWQSWFFISTAIVICVAIIAWLCRLSREEKYLKLGLSLIFGGAIGNLWDRITLGYVIDFIEFHLNQWYFPAFNLADSAITMGAILLLIKLFVTKK